MLVYCRMWMSILDQETYTVGITPVLLPYFTNLSSEFTVFDMYIEMSFKSVYSQRFYEFCCQYRNKEDKIFFMTVHDIKKMFNLLEIKDEKGNIIQKEQYKNGSDFKKRVLDKAKNDIRKLFKRDFVTFVLIIRLRARTPEVLLLPTILS